MKGGAALKQQQRELPTFSTEGWNAAHYAVEAAGPDNDWNIVGLRAVKKTRGGLNLFSTPDVAGLTPFHVAAILADYHQNYSVVDRLVKFDVKRDETVFEMVEDPHALASAINSAEEEIRACMGSMLNGATEILAINNTSTRASNVSFDGNKQTRKLQTTPAGVGRGSTFA